MKARNELWLLTFCAFGVNYMLRININIAIVDMVVSNKNQPQTTVEDYGKGNWSQTLSKPESTQNRMKFHWDEYEQNLILSAYFWSNWILQLPGGLLAYHFGTKHTLGLNNFFCAILTFFIPLAASYGFRVLFILRMVQGFIAGAFWPSMAPMVGKWIPPKERGTFISAYLGSSAGTAFTYFVSGIIIDHFGWEYAFYVTGTLGVIWWIFWVICVHETPQEHPRISKEEREYIEESLGNTVNRKQLSIPWKKILTSRAVLINAITQCGTNGVTMTLLTHIPMYLSYIHGLRIQNTGLWSGVPHLTRWIAAFCFGLVAERLHSLSVSNIRKLATAIGTIAVAFTLYVLAIFEVNTICAVFLLILANTLHGTYPAGPIASVIDLSPNFGGIIQGLIGIPGAIPGFLYPLIVGHLTKNNQTSAQWQKFFFFVSTVTLVCGTVYMFFGTSKVQPWNSEKGTNKEEDSLKKTEHPMMVKYGDKAEK